MAANATAVWRVRPSGVNTNGGGYDSGIASAGTDYSQQNAAQLSNIGATSTATTTLTDLGASFTSALIGNAIYVSGTGIATSWTFIMAVPTSTTLTLQTSPGTTGTTVTYHIGGAWADFWTNTTSSGPAISGNIIYILGSGTPNPSSYTYDYTTPSFVSFGGPGVYANDPATPGYLAPPNTTGGMPCIKFTGASIFANQPTNDGVLLRGLWFVAGAGISAGSTVVAGAGNGNFSTAIGCVLDQFGFDVCLLSGTAFGTLTAVACEVFSSQGGSGGSYAAIYSVPSTNSNEIFVVGCNIHDCVGYGVYVSLSGSFFQISVSVIDSIIAKCSKTGIYADMYGGRIIKNNTIDGNGLNGIDLGTIFTGPFTPDVITNNILSNHTAGGAYGQRTGGTSILYDFDDYNTYYNNTADLDVATYGPHDTHGGANPYVNQATENYALA